MITITKSSNNIVCLTLQEKATLSSPVYLFRFISDIEKREKSFIASDLSSFPTRFQQFLITETSGTEVLTSGTITLSPAGFWHYEIYEQESTSNLNHLLSLNPDKPLEVGKVKVIGDAIVIKKNNTMTKTFKTHNPNG